MRPPISAVQDIQHGTPNNICKWGSITTNKLSTTCHKNILKRGWTVLLRVYLQILRWAVIFWCHFIGHPHNLPCQNPSLSVIIRLYPSLSIIIRHYPSKSVFIHHYTSLSVKIRHPSKYVIIRHYPSLSVIIRLHPSLFVFICHF